MIIYLFGVKEYALEKEYKQGFQIIGRNFHR